MKARVLAEAFLLFLLSAQLVVAQSFQGPSSGPGVGQGAIGIDANRNLSVGTSTPQADTKLFILASSTTSGGFAIRVAQPGVLPLFYVRNDGRVGIVAAPDPDFILNVGGNTKVIGTLEATTLEGTFTGTAVANNITPGVFNDGTGNFAFGASLGIATSTQVGLPQELSVYGDGYFSGNVGIDTTSPGAKLDVNGNVRIPNTGLLVGRNAANSADLTLVRLSAGDDLELGGGAGNKVDTVSLFSTNGRLFLDGGGNVGIGTTAPSANLQVNSNASPNAYSLIRTTASAGAAGSGPFGLVIGDNAQDPVNYRGLRLALDNNGNGVIESFVAGSHKNILLTPLGPGKVGIGTAAPSSTLHVVGSATFSQPVSVGTPTQDQHATTKSYVDSAVGGGGESGSFSTITVSGTSTFATSGGNVGIGTTGPGSKLHVSGGKIELDNNQWLSIQDSAGTRRDLITLDSSNDLIIRNPAGSGDIVLHSDTTGNVGIGTTGPSARLDIRDTDANNPSVQVFNSAGTRRAWLGDSGSNNGGDLLLYDSAGTLRTLIRGGADSYITSGNLGIGDSSPTEGKLVVSGTGYFTSTVTVGTPTADSHAATKSYVDSATVGDTGWTDSGANVHLTTASDSVGIGTASPTRKLHVSGGAILVNSSNDGNNYIVFDQSAPSNQRAGGIAFVAKDATGDANQRSLVIGRNIYFDGTNWKKPSDNSASYWGQTSAIRFPAGKIEFITHPAGETGTDITFTPPVRMTVDNSGNVGIGTASPGQTLDVAGVVRWGASGQGLLSYGSGVATIETSGNAGQITLKTDGNVGIGTTGPDAKLRIDDTHALARFETVDGQFRIRTTRLGAFQNADLLLSAQQNLILYPDGNGGAYSGGGNVGVGDTTPTEGKLVVSGTGYFTSTVTVGTSTADSHAATKSYVDSATVGQTGWTDGGADVYLTTLTDQVGIGTSGPTNPLHVVGNSENNYAINALQNATGTSAGLYVQTSNTSNSGNNEILALANTTGRVVVVKNSGNVGIGTTVPGASLHVVKGSTGLIARFGQDETNHAVEIYNANPAPTGGTAPLRIGSASGDSIYTTGNVGIGTTSPKAADGSARTLQIGNNFVMQNVIGAQVLVGDNVHYDGAWKYANTGAARAVRLGHSSAITFHIAASGTAGATITNWDGSDIRMVIDSNGEVGIGTGTNPAYKLEVIGTGRFSNTLVVGTPTADAHAATKSYVDSASVGNAASCSADATCEMNGADLNNGNITGVNKISVTTIDPVYQINGVKYATYVSDTIGLKMEHYGKGRLAASRGEFGRDGKRIYEYVIDFGLEKTGSDLWLFWQTIDEGAGMRDIILTLTPEGGPARLWYELRPEREQIAVRGDRPVAFSYHLVAPRHDQKEWPTILVDTHERGTVLPVRQAAY